MKEQILIVEDEQDTAELLRYNLERSDYTTMIARNGEEAIDVVQCSTPDLVLLDVMMPELNGWEVCRILRESSKGKTIPIIMLSALADEEARVKGLSLGADDYIAKPFSVNEVLLKIGRHLKHRQVVREFQAREQEQDTSLKYLVHELRNAMSVIGGFSTLALKKSDPLHYLRTIKKSADHVNSLLKDASLLARLEKGKETLPIEPFDIGSLAKEASDMFADTSQNDNGNIVIVNQAPTHVLGNRTATRQVLINLLSNAIKYNRENGKVWFSFEENQNRVDVSITDEGRGIPAVELPKVFEKYYRASGSDHVKGAGLGLYIVKLLTRAMGATIKVVSNPGRGSSFTVSFQKATIRESGDAKATIEKIACS